MAFCRIDYSRHKRTDYSLLDYLFWLSVFSSKKCTRANNRVFLLTTLDTTHDVSKKDQLSKVFPYVKIDYHDDGTPSALKVVEAFTSFIEVVDSSAIGLHKRITNSIQQKELDIKNCPGQGCDGAAVMSGKYSSLHKKIQDVAPHAYYVHCASHNLNLMLKDAMEAVTETH